MHCVNTARKLTFRKGNRSVCFSKSKQRIAARCCCCLGQITRDCLPAPLCVWCQSGSEEVHGAPGSRIPTVNSHFTYAFISPSDLYIICWGLTNSAGHPPSSWPHSPQICLCFQRLVNTFSSTERKHVYEKQMIENKDNKDSLASGCVFTAVQFTVKKQMCGHKVARQMLLLWEQIDTRCDMWDLKFIFLEFRLIKPLFPNSDPLNFSLQCHRWDLFIQKNP